MERTRTRLARAAVAATALGSLLLAGCLLDEAPAPAADVTADSVAEDGGPTVTDVPVADGVAQDTGPVADVPMADVPLPDSGPMSDTGAGDTSLPDSTLPTLISFDPVAEPGVATDITLEIYSDGWGTLLDTQTLATEGDAKISVDEAQPYNDPPTYYIYARADGFYTKIYYCAKGETIHVDLDAVPTYPEGFAGVLIAQQSFFADAAIAHQTVEVLSGDVSFGSFTTDDEGRFGFYNMPTGDLTFRFAYDQFGGGGEIIEVQATKESGRTYHDLQFFEPAQAAKPNIYLYPPAATDVDVTLSFPQGGRVTTSDPGYGDGWHVQVAPDGRITAPDGSQHTFLFYESEQPTEVDTSTGWLVDGAALDQNLAGIMGELGFQGQEIVDFTDWWTPRILADDAPVYAVYPVVDDALGAMIGLDIQPRPDHVRRVLLVVRPLQAPVMLAPPSFAPVSRDGFSVFEWGVVQDMKL